MQQVTENVFTSTKIRGCNPSFVVTAADGTVHGPYTSVDVAG